jgi:hypothetical protein
MPRITGTWDSELPGLRLENVRIHADSMTGAWRAVGTEHLVRSVLVYADPSPAGSLFVFESSRCSVGDVHAALAEHYRLERRQDDNTGVTWFWPMGRPVGMLARRVRVPRDQPGLPMQSGVLEPLGAGRLAGVSTKSWGSAFRNTFDYAVDVPAGTYRIVDLLNLCCVANPTKTLAVHIGDEALLTAVNLSADSPPGPRAGALYYWDREVRRTRDSAGPTDDQFIGALADPDANVRRAARNYLDAVIERIDVEALVRRSTIVEDSLWTCIGAVSVLVRSVDATYLPAIDVMRRRATDDFLASGELGVATVTALDLVRLTGDRRALDVVMQRRLDPRALAPVASDVSRIAALSPLVRQALADPHHRAFVTAMAAVASLDPPTLEFELTE